MTSRVVHFVVDVSGSMSTNNRLEAAKAALTSIVPTLDSDTWAGLRTFGVSGCDTRLNIPPAPIDDTSFLSEVSGHQPSGNTPLADGLAAAAVDLQGVTATSKTIVLLADGDNNCGGDPCQVARDIASSGTNLVVNTAGIQLSGAARTTLECIAAATGGRYVDVSDPQDLTRLLGGVIGRQLRYVALGDSYSSGEGAGAGNYFQWYETWYRCTNPRTGQVSEYRFRPPAVLLPQMSCSTFRNLETGRDIGCHRAPTAWSFPLAVRSAQIRDEVENTACSGATLRRNLLDVWKDNEQPQVRRLKALNSEEPVDLVTFTIGGNDVGFSNLVTACFLRWGAGWRWRDCAREDRKVLATLPKVNFLRALREIASAAPNATIGLVSYPQIAPQNHRDTANCGWLTNAEREAVRRVVGEINLAQWRAVEQAKAEGIRAVFIDISDALLGHELCTKNSHLVRVYGNKFNTEQAHPDSVDRSSTGGTSGQEDMANAVYRELIRLGVITR